ncbi:MAG: four helix bundle protein [Clostridia bacterium]
METKTEKENKLQLIPKTEKYIEYMLQLITKLPRVEKFNIGNEYKLSMYEMLRNIMYLSKIEKSKCLEIANNIDAELNTQRIYLIIMKNNKWIDERKFKIAMEQIYEIGKILGGLIKYYAKNIKK